MGMRTGVETHKDHLFRRRLGRIKTMSNIAMEKWMEVIISEGDSTGTYGALIDWSRQIVGVKFKSEAWTVDLMINKVPDQTL